MDLKEKGKLFFLKFKSHDGRDCRPHPDRIRRCHNQNFQFEIPYFTWFSEFQTL